MAQINEIGSVATIVTQAVDGWTYVLYHKTYVVRFNDEEIKLDTGGWYSFTTKVRMNQASNQFGLGYKVYQKNFIWFVSYNKEVIPFVNGVVILKRKQIKKQNV